MKWLYVIAVSFLLLNSPEYVLGEELQAGGFDEQIQGHKITVPVEYFTNESGMIDRKAHKKFLDLYAQFNQKHDLSKSQEAMQRALAFFAKNRGGIPQSCGGDLGAEKSPNDQKGYPPVNKIENQRYVVFVDYTVPHPEDRLFILDLKTGEVQKSSSSHGYGSNKPGCPTEHKIGRKCRIPVSFGNKYVRPPGKGEGKTSRGFFMIQGGYRSAQKTFTGGRPRSRGHNALHLRGLIGGTNDNAFKRSVVLHRASYYARASANSAGCPTLDPRIFENMKEGLPGAMLYLHTIEDAKRDRPDC